MLMGGMVATSLVVDEECGSSTDSALLTVEGADSEVAEGKDEQGAPEEERMDELVEEEEDA